MNNTIRQGTGQQSISLERPSEYLAIDRQAFDSTSQQGFHKDARSGEQGDRQSRGRQKATDKILTERFALFEEKLLQAHGSRHLDSRLEERPDNDHEEQIQVLFDSSAPSRSQGQGQGHMEQETMRSESGQRAERLFKLISPRLDAAIRPGPTVSTGQIKIEIPIGNAYSGLNRVDVILSDTEVVVKFLLPPKAGNKTLDESLQIATEQLGQLLKMHLPDRRIKIERSTLLREGLAEVESGDSVSTGGVDSLLRRGRLEVSK